MTKSIVMIHGMWVGGWSWDNFQRFFEERGYDCHTPTLRHHDKEPNDTPDPYLGTTSLLDYAQDLEAYIRDMDEKPLVMGHSMGGLLSQIIASRGIVNGAVLLTPVAPSGINNLKWSTLKALRSIFTKWGFWKKPIRLSFQSLVYAALHLLPETDQKSIYEKCVYDSGRAFFEIAQWYADLKSASKVDETKVKCPVLVVAGKHDRLTPASVVKRVSEKYHPVSTYKEFENHAHFIIGEPGWMKVAEFVADWIERTFERKGSSGV
jgi:pimeloyl-ACP methyl ester carboxylesterase